MKLHLGCFDQPCEGWFNTDITPHLFVARVPGAATLLHFLKLLPEHRYRQHRAGVFRKVHYLNLRKPFPMQDKSVECAFSSHVLEHLHPEDARRVMAEVLRVLKPGGIFRVAVPDLEWALALYRKEDPEKFLAAVYEHDHKNPKNRHQWMYTDLSLRSSLLEAGFDDVRICTFREGRLPDLDRIDNRPENSIYVEGCKPAK